MAFNTPVTITLGGQERQFPRLLMEDLELLCQQYIKFRQDKIRASQQALGIKADELPGLLLAEELGDFDLVRSCKAYARTGRGCKACLWASLAKTCESADPTSRKAHAQKLFQEWLGQEDPNLILDLASEVISPPPLPPAANMDNTQSPPPSGQGESAG